MLWALVDQSNAAVCVCVCVCVWVGRPRGRIIVSAPLMWQFPSFQSPLAEDDQLNEETFGEGAVGTLRVGYLLVDSNNDISHLLILILCCRG